MDFLDPKKQRARTIQLFIGYGLVGVAIIVATTILLYQAYGFGLDRKGQLIQNGLVYFSSQPGGADIYLNDKQDGATNSRMNLPAADYSVDLKRTGYRDWSRNITVEGGQLTRYDYPLLIPQTLATTNRQAFDRLPIFATESPNRRWLLTAEAPTGAATGLRFTQLDLNNPEDAATTFTLPDSVAAVDAATSGWSVVEWSNDNQHVLLNYDGTFIMLDREDPSQSVNVSAALSSTAADIRLQDKRFDQFFVFDSASQQLSSATLDDPTLEPVATGVLQFETYGTDTILYATSEGAVDGKARIQLIQDGQTYTIRTVAAGSAYLLNLTRYEDDWYVAAGAAGEDKVYSYTNPVDVLSAQPARILVPTTVLRVAGVNFVEFSANTRFLAASGGNNVAVYDAELDETHTYSLAAVLDQPQTHPRWMDGHRLTWVSGGKAQIVDFENSNAQVLADADPRFRVFYDDNYNNLYTMTVSPEGKAILKATPLLTPADR